MSGRLTKGLLTQALAGIRDERQMLLDENDLLRRMVKDMARRYVGEPRITNVTFSEEIFEGDAEVQVEWDQTYRRFIVRFPGP